MVLRLPSSVLFPYTTLFRSLLQEAGAAQRLRRDDLAVDVYHHLDLDHAGDARAPGGVGIGGRGQVDGLAVQDAAREDRKSTRLNSSHGYISYAVFCLKKKKC